MEVELSVSEGVGSGSVYESTCVRIQKSYVKYFMNGNAIVCVGTVKGKTAVIDILDALMEQTLRSEEGSCIGARNGMTMFSAAIATLRLENIGEDALAIGGPKGDVKAHLQNVDTKVTMHNSSGRDTFAADEDITFVNGSCSIFVNDTEIKRKLVYQFENTKGSET